MIKYFISRHFLSFLLTGGIAAIVNFISRIAINRFTDYSSAIVLSYIIGMITAFVLAKMFVFKDSQKKISHSAMYFILVNLVAIIQTWIISIGFANYVLPNMGVTVYVHEISHAVGIMVPVFTSYIGHKRWSFS